MMTLGNRFKTETSLVCRCVICELIESPKMRDDTATLIITPIDLTTRHSSTPRSMQVMVHPIIGNLSTVAR